jgi:hypothetical protein
MKLVKVLLVIFVVAAGFNPTTASAATRFISCDELLKSWTSAPAKNEKSRTSYIKWKKDNYYDVLISISVMPAVYRKNASLDFDKDGILCEELYESRAVAENMARTAGRFAAIMDCSMKFWNWDSSRSICTKP